MFKWAIISVICLWRCNLSSITWWMILRVLFFLTAEAVSFSSSSSIVSFNLIFPSILCIDSFIYLPLPSGICYYGEPTLYETPDIHHRAPSRSRWLRTSGCVGNRAELRASEAEIVSLHNGSPNGRFHVFKKGLSRILFPVTAVKGFDRRAVVTSLLLTSSSVSPHTCCCCCCCGHTSLKICLCRVQTTAPAARKITGSFF